MPRVCFTQNIQRHVACPATEAAGGSVAEVLAAVFADNDKARGYVLDDQGAVRKHVVIFVDGVPISDRTRLSDVVSPQAEIFVMQALSGG
jgi:sulfur-carrier protein